MVFLKNINNQDLSKIYQLSEFVVFPSYYEGFGLPALEALQSGKNILVSSNTSLAEVVNNCGYILPFDDIEVWAKSIRNMIDKNTFTNIEKKCKNHLQKFDSEIISNQIMQEYIKLFQ